MKQLLVLCIFILAGFVVVAQNLSVNTKYVNYTNFENSNIDVIFINQIDNLTELKVSPSAGVNIKWYKYNLLGLGNEISNQDFISPENNTGYVLEYNGVKKFLWVFDYQQVKPLINSFSPESVQEDACKNILLNIHADTYKVNYFSVNGNVFYFHFSYNISYKSLQWVESSKTFNEIDVKEMNVVMKSQNQKVEISSPPLKDTYFVLEGDQVAADLGLEKTAFTSELYSAVKTEAYMFTETTVRTEKNEAERPENNTVLSGSAPLEISFTGYANSPVASLMNWKILRESDLILNRSGDNQIYTFTEAGSYVVKFTASNAKCSYSDSVIVKVSESAIFAPNVFTPNADGVNDEFRVAFKSIIHFKGVIFNRWGRKVFSWTDPTKGWDGNIGGHPASPGAYFYIIEAEGSDKKIHHLKGDINLLRGNTK